MTDKEFRRLSKSELIDIIYEYQKQQKLLMAENAALTKKLEDRDFKLKDAGNIAEAFASLSGIFEKAQETADQYVAYAKMEAKRIVEEAKKEAMKND